jgi:hypothetical protein
MALTAQLNSGASIPLLGFGTAGISTHDTIKSSITTAIQVLEETTSSSSTQNPRKNHQTLTLKRPNQKNPIDSYRDTHLNCRPPIGDSANNNPQSLRSDRVM